MSFFIICILLLQSLNLDLYRKLGKYRMISVQPILNLDENGRRMDEKIFFKSLLINASRNIGIFAYMFSVLLDRLCINDYKRSKTGN